MARACPARDAPLTCADVLQCRLEDWLEAELDDIYETERRLLYMARTRAIEHLLLKGANAESEYLQDFVDARLRIMVPKKNN